MKRSRILERTQASKFHSNSYAFHSPTISGVGKRIRYVPPLACWSFGFPEVIMTQKVWFIGSINVWFYLCGTNALHFISKEGICDDEEPTICSERRARTSKTHKLLVQNIRHVTLLVLDLIEGYSCQCQWSLFLSYILLLRYETVRHQHGIFCHVWWNSYWKLPSWVDTFSSLEHWFFSLCVGCAEDDSKMSTRTFSQNT